MIKKKLARDHHLGFLVAAPAVLGVDHAGLTEDRDAHARTDLRLGVGRNHPDAVAFLEAAGLGVLRMHVDGGFGFKFEQVRLVAAGLRVRDVRTTRAVDKLEREFLRGLRGLDVLGEAGEAVLANLVEKFLETLA